MKFKALVIYLTLITISASAQNQFDAGTISKDLLPYAGAVVRNEEVNVTVNDLDNVTYHVKRVVTVLNKNGDKDATIVLWHNKETSIKDVKGLIYNSAGVQTAKFAEKDFKDQYGDDGFSLFNDVQIRYYEPAEPEYPYTIMCEYELKFKQTMSLPDWEPNPETGVAIEKSSYNFTCKPDFNIRYKEINMPSAVTITTGKDGIKTYSWQVNNMKAIKNEPYKPVEQNYLSMVKIAPEKFEYDGVTGSFHNWNDLGKWVYDKLLAGRQTVSPGTADYIKQLTAGINDPKLKAKKIYEYMQDRTRYVSIQVGIGGFQPFPAAEVDDSKYGDCKALVNYTQALLKVVDIDSWYCQVEADHEQKINYLTDFASMDQGNHIILCIPFKNDTTWCDCTSQEIPFGYIGDFTDDRILLACTPAGGKLMHTPKYTVDDNLVSRKADVALDANGAISGTMNTNFKGVEYENRDYIISESPTERIKEIQSRYPINNLKIEKLDYTQDKSLKPVTTEHLQFSAFEYGSASDNKIYFLPGLASRVNSVPRQVRNRVTDTYINEGITIEDDITYTLPAGYHVESEALNVSLDKPFGIFTVTTRVDGNKLIYHRKFKLIDGNYSKDTYQDLVDFYQDVYDADNENLTLVKN